VCTVSNLIALLYIVARSHCSRVSHKRPKNFPETVRQTLVCRVLTKRPIWIDTNIDFKKKIFPLRVGIFCRPFRAWRVNPHLPRADALGYFHGRPLRRLYKENLFLNLYSLCPRTLSVSCSSTGHIKRESCCEACAW